MCSCFCLKQQFTTEVTFGPEGHLAMSGDNFWLSHWGKGCFWPLEARDAAKYPIDRAAPTTESTQPTMPIMLRLRISVLEYPPWFLCPVTPTHLLRLSSDVPSVEPSFLYQAGPVLQANNVSFLLSHMHFYFSTSHVRLKFLFTRVSLLGGTPILVIETVLYYL